MKKIILSLIVSLFATYSQAGEARLLRFPAISNGRIVFSYAGDLYSVAAAGGVARKLTSHEGYEMFARFSADGKWLAFTAQYDGNTEVYLMPAEGGEPRRLTWTPTLSRDYVWDRMGPNNIVMAWKNDNRTIVFRSRMREANDFKGHLFSTTVDGDLAQQLPLPRGGFCSFSPDDSRMAYNRVFREFRTWKRYRGGMADDIWIYEFGSKKTIRVTDHPAQDIIPMWHGEQIYFLSDRDDNKRMNLFVHDLESGETRQLTRYSEFDVKFPSLGGSSIVYEMGGRIYRYDIESGAAEMVPVSIADDRAGRRGGLIEVKDNIVQYEISPDGKRALFGARGELFTVPQKKGPTRNLSSTSGVHERSCKWSPDGRWISYISDADGETEICIRPQDGSGEARRITSGAETYKYLPVWSPDGSKLLWSDRKQRLRFVDVKSGAVTEVAQSKEWEIRDYAWSPDSKWIAYVRPERDVMNRIMLYSLDGGRTFEVTEGWYSSSGPAFSADGKYLFFISDRDFNPIYSQTEWNHAYVDMERIYLVTLARETESPFKPESDEVEIKKESEEGAEKPDKEKETEGEKKVVLKVDPDGLAGRIVALPIDASDYSHLTSAGDALYYSRNGRNDEKTRLLLYDFKERKETDLGQADGYEISHDGKKMLFSAGGGYAIIDLPKAKVEIKEKLDLSGLKMRLDRSDEWAQIYDECWRHMRDFFYAPNMHGVDWPALKEKYRPLVDHVAHRADLTYVIGELVGELNVGHAYVGGGDTPDVERIQTGRLGAELERDPDSRYIRIVKILRGRSWDKSLRSPLTEIGVNAREGEYILSIDGRDTRELDNFYSVLVGRAGDQVVLKLNAVPSEQGSRDVVVVPIDNEAPLYYYNWVQDNIRKVSEATDGRVGYLHVPDMGRAGLNAFVEYYYPQIRKKGLIIDVRGNGGGNVSPMLIERLRREMAMIDVARNTVQYPDPGTTHIGPKVCLMDEFSASDGDLFPYRFKKYGLGPLIGKRSWGGVVGIRGTLPLADGGYLMRPEFTSYDTGGEEWIIEGRGVEPDIVVDNDPAMEYEGLDQQLNKAIEVILEKLETADVELPPPPPYPEK